MRILRPTNQKLKVTLCLGSISFISAREILEQLERLARFPGDKLGGLVDGPFIPEKSRDYLYRKNILGSDLSELGCTNTGGVIYGEAQQQKSNAYQEENNSVLNFDSRTVPSLKEAKPEVRWVQCKEQENRYIEELVEHNFAKQIHWDAK
jgi:hypothetical protein